LLRRVTLDLTGLPPAPDDVQISLQRNSPDSYQRLVSRLIDSPRFGERLALPWLDTARYADTHGYLIDAHREMWRWRDWVIDAWNRNLRFDQFTIEQLAGDLLPGATADQILATGFNRNHMINYENGADPEEYRIEYVADRAATTANVWLGLTFQCARCHDHKYDPLSLREFYEWFAFFNNVPEKGLDGNLGNAAPVLLAPTLEQQRRLADLESRQSANEELIRKKRAEAITRMASWESSLVADRTIRPEARDAWLRVGLDQPDQLAQDAAGQRVPFQVRGTGHFVPGRRERAILLDGNTYVDLDSIRWADKPAGVTFAAWVFPTTADPMNLATLLDSRQKPRVEFGLEDRSPVVRISTGIMDAPFVARAKIQLQQARWQHLAVTWDGTSAGKMQWFLDGVSVPAGQERESAGLPDSFGGVWRVGSDGHQRGFRGLLDEFVIFSRELQAGEIAGLARADPVQTALAIPARRRTPDQIRVLCDAYLQITDSEYPQLLAKQDSLKRQLAAVRRSIPTSMVMRELPSPRATFVLRRGKFDQPGKQVEPGTPAALPPFPPHLPRNRLGLAQWLVQPDHPLTARVMVNRLWQIFFGTGLVTTPEDFGIRGDPPTHPELLDWLAVEFVESGWDVKHLVRLIVTSETYRQSSRVDPELYQLDPENRWLARAPRLRMEAETVRDSILFVGGLLDQRIGGPSVYPYQPPGLWEEVSFNPAEFSAQTYNPSHGADLYRRGIYSFWKRTLPPPAMAIFDAPTRETCVAVRGRSNTPLQALVLMNDPMVVEAARHLAERGLREHGESPESIVVFLFQVTTSRVPTWSEQRELTGLFERQRARFGRQPAAARQLLAIGDSPRDEQLDLVRHAAWTVVANVILGLDESVVRI
jgi:hypothetical protein